MGRLLDRWAGTGALALILAAAVAAALRVNYALVVLMGLAGLGLLLVAFVLSSRRTAKGLEDLAATFGTRVVEHRQEEGGGAWFAERGFTDYGGQVVRRLRTRSVEVPGGAVEVVEARLGAGKPLRFRATVLSAAAHAPGAICLYDAGVRSRWRAKFLGGTVTTNGPLDEHYVVYGTDPAAAAAVARVVDVDAVDDVFRRIRAHGLRTSPGFAATPARVSVLAEGPSPKSLLAPEGARETIDALRRCVRA